MDIRTFISLAPNMPADKSILMRGETGVGKSQIARLVAGVLGLEFIDVRGSTMDESKVTGIPDFLASKEQGVSTFVLPSWFVRACRGPCLLMLDELNRSLPQVQQAFFQVVLDRSLGNDANGLPMVLHKDSRVYAAVNASASYDVNDMDPALLRRFWVQDLEPTVEDWLKWASTEDESGESRIDPVMIDFIKQHPQHLRVDPGKVAPGTVCPNNASWHHTDQTLKHAGMAPSKVAGSVPEGFYQYCTGFVGVEASIAFTEFVKKYSNQISGQDILDGKLSDTKAKKLKASDALGLIDKVLVVVKKNSWTPDQSANFIKFMKCLPQEQLLHMWTSFIETTDTKIINPIHKEFGLTVVELVRKAKAISAVAAKK